MPAHLGRLLALTEEDLGRLEKNFNKNPKKLTEETKFSLDHSASRQTTNQALLQRDIKSYRPPKKFTLMMRISKKKTLQENTSI